MFLILLGYQPDTPPPQPSLPSYDDALNYGKLQKY